VTIVLSWLVAVTDVAQFVPQALRALRLRRRAGALLALSLRSWSIATAQAILWIVYGFGANLLAIAIPNLVIAPVSALVLALAIAARRRQRRAAPPATPAD
jgi:uncharacterized protein with PQ loop repeat